MTEVVVAYLEHAKSYYGGGNRSEFAGMRLALRAVRHLYGPQPASDFGPQQLKAVRESFIAAGNSRKYINQQVRRIGRAFRWAASEGLIDASVPQSLSMLPGLRRGHTTARETERIRPIDDALVEATLQHLPPVVRSMVELQRITGMRSGELCICDPVT